VDKPVALVAVRLNDVRPDGSVTRITYTLQNLTHIVSHEHPEALEPGERYFARIKLDDIAWHLPEGHRLQAVHIDQLLADDVAGTGAGGAYRPHCAIMADSATASAHRQ
jgi:predicted acyl esterase